MARYEDDERDARPRRRSEYDDRDDDRNPRRAADPARRERLMDRRLRAREQGYEDDEQEYDEPRGYSRAHISYDDSNYAPRGGGGGGWFSAGLITLLGFVAVAVVLFFLGRQFLGGISSSIQNPISSVVQQPTPAIIDRGGTILQIRNLNRLETKSFSAERVIEASVQRGNILDALLGERLLLIARGDVVAGVDLSKLQQSNVVVTPDGTGITLTLPQSEIFSASLDNGNTRVYDKTSGVATRLFGTENKDLETQARQSAQGEILKAACESNIMQQSADEAKRSLEQFLGLLDFTSVTVNAPAGQCVAPVSVAPLPTAATDDLAPQPTP